MYIPNKNEIISNFSCGIESNNYRSILLSLRASLDRFNRDLLENNYNGITKTTNLKNDTRFIEEFNKIDSTAFFLFINKRERIQSARENLTDNGIGGVYDVKNGIVRYWKDENSFGEFIEIIRTIVNNTDHGEKNLYLESNIDLLKNSSIVFKDFLEKLYKNFNLIP